MRDSRIDTRIRSGVTRHRTGSVAALVAAALLLWPLGVLGQLAASVLPGSRSVQVGVQASAFATLINAGAGTATGCSIAPQTQIPASFFYQPTDPQTNEPAGSADTPVDIAAGAARSFVIGFTPTQAFAPVQVEFAFDCADTAPAPTVPGVNTLLLSAADEPPPDVVALAATPSGDGIANIPNATGTGVFSVASVNLGSGATLEVSAAAVDPSSRVVVSLCETDPATAGCVNPAVPGPGPVSSTIEAQATPTYGVFVRGRGQVDLDAIGNRVAVRFDDAGGVPRGATSVAVRSVAEPLDVSHVAELARSRFGNEVDPTLAVLLAYDGGYSLRQIVDAILAGWLTLQGRVVDDLGLASPDGEPLGFIERDDGLRGDGPPGKTWPKAQLTEEQLRAELVLVGRSMIELMFVSIFIFGSEDPGGLFVFWAAIATAYDELVEELRQAALPVCKDKILHSPQVASESRAPTGSGFPLKAATDVICVTDNWFEPLLPQEAVYLGPITVTVDSYSGGWWDPGDLVDRYQITGTMEITVPPNPQHGTDIIVRSDIVHCDDLDVVCDCGDDPECTHLVFTEGAACLTGALDTHDHRGFVGFDGNLVIQFGSEGRQLDVKAYLGSDQVTSDYTLNTGNNCLGFGSWARNFKLTLDRR